MTLYMLGNGTCPKCDHYSGVDAAIQYIPRTQIGTSCLFAEEHIRISCPLCGYYESQPCADAPKAVANGR